LVEVEVFAGFAPDVTAFVPPKITLLPPKTSIG